MQKPDTPIIKAAEVNVNELANRFFPTERTEVDACAACRFNVVSPIGTLPLRPLTQTEAEYLASTLNAFADEDE